MIVSTSQPYFAPYPGFFHKASLADCLVILDDVQFPRKTTWITRNRFKSDQGALWMTIPVLKKGLGLQKISDVRICHAGNWKRKHLQSLKSAYANAPYLTDHQALMQMIFTHRYDRILDLNMEIIDYVWDCLNIKSQKMFMSQLGVTGKGTSLILAICKALGADRFLVQSSALAYYDAAQFESRGIELISFKKPEYIYPQMWGDFIANLSVLDMLLICGDKSRDIILAQSRTAGDTV